MLKVFLKRFNRNNYNITLQETQFFHAVKTIHAKWLVKATDKLSKNRELITRDYSAFQKSRQMLFTVFKNRLNNVNLWEINNANYIWISVFIAMHRTELSLLVSTRMLRRNDQSISARRRFWKLKDSILDGLTMG